MRGKWRRREKRRRMFRPLSDDLRTGNVITKLTISINIGAVVQNKLIQVYLYSVSLKAIFCFTSLGMRTDPASLYVFVIKLCPDIRQQLSCCNDYTGHSICCQKR